MNRRILRFSLIRVLLAFVCFALLVSSAAWAFGSQEMAGCRSGESPPHYGVCGITPPPLTPSPTLEQEAYVLNLQALAAADAGDWARAESLMEQALQKTPTDPVLLENIARADAQLGIAAYNKGDYTTALGYFQKGLASDPANDPATDKLRGYISAYQGKIAAAQHAQQGCPETIPLATLLANPDAYDGKAVWVVAYVNVEFESMTVCPSGGQYPDPEKCLWLTIDDGPSSNDQDSAREQSLFQRWQQFDRQTVAVHATFGKDRDGHLRTWPGSLRDTAEVLGSENSWSFTSNAAVPRSPCADALGVPKVSSADKTLDPAVAQYLHNAALKRQHQDYDGAIADFTHAIALDPGNKIYYFFRSDAEMDNHDYAGAIADSNRMIAIDPKFDGAYWMRSEAEQKMGNAKAAAADSARAKELDKGDHTP